jgi:hypothetical protein
MLALDSSESCPIIFIIGHDSRTKATHQTDGRMTSVRASTTALATLEDQARSYAEAARSANTLRAYETDFADFT